MLVRDSNGRRRPSWRCGWKKAPESFRKIDRRARSIRPDLRREQNQTLGWYCRQSWLPVSKLPRALGKPLDKKRKANDIVLSEADGATDAVLLGPMTQSVV